VTRWLNSLFAYDRWEVVRIDRGFTVSNVRLRNIYSGRIRSKFKDGLWYVEDFPNRVWRG
jgi:hypothetical protein